MKTIHKMIIGAVVLFIALFFLLNSLLQEINSAIEMEKEKYEKHVGEKHIIDKDTLTIIDYSTVRQTFTLSNGKEVSYKLISKEP